jgi:hypothetical protein
MSIFHDTTRQTHPGRKEPDGWDCARFWELFLNLSSFPFSSLGLLSRTPKGYTLTGCFANAHRWAADIAKKELLRRNRVFSFLLETLIVIQFKLDEPFGTHSTGKERHHETSSHFRGRYKP